MVSEFVSIATGVVASDDITVNLAIDIETQIVSGLDKKKLGEISFKRKNQTKNFVTMRKSVKAGKTLVKM